MCSINNLEPKKSALSVEVGKSSFAVGWEYVSVCRRFVFLERSIDGDSRWGVFEPNGDGRSAESGRTGADGSEDEFRLACWSP